MTEDILFLVDDLNLRVDNPYSIGNVLALSDSEFELIRPTLTYEKSPKDRYYTTSENENLPGIAFDAYGNSKWWWVIYDTNKNIDNPFNLPSSTTLIIPDLDSIFLNN